MSFQNLKQRAKAIPLLHPLYIRVRARYNVLATLFRKAREGRSFGRSYFDSAFQKSDPWNYIGAHQQERLALLLGQIPENTRKALEIGCAEGAFTQMLTEKVQFVTAIDLSLIALRRAREKCAGKNVVFIQADTVRLPLRLTFDVVICTGILPYLPEDDLFDLACLQILRVLIPGGTLVLENFWGTIDGSRSGRAIHDAFCRFSEFQMQNLIREQEYGISTFQKSQ